MSVELSTLPENAPFRCDWRRPEVAMGRVIRPGSGSVRVHVPRVEGDGWEDTTWSPTTLVEPIIETEFKDLLANGDTRQRSTVKSPVAIVWELCEEHGGDRAKVLPAALAQGININTAKTQFYAWRNRNKR